MKKLLLKMAFSLLNSVVLMTVTIVLILPAYMTDNEGLSVALTALPCLWDRGG